MRIRRLLSPEVAFTKTNEKYPLCITVVLHLENGPAPDVLRRALAQLQVRHPMLNVGIERGRSEYWFVHLPEPMPIPLDVVNRGREDTWRTEAERLLNERFPTDGPLMRAVYLPAVRSEGKAELILVFHHGFIDSQPLRLLLHELLSLCGGESLPAREPGQDELAIQRPRIRFPTGYRGLSMVSRLLPFLGRQFREERWFQRKGAGLPVPGSSHNALIGLALSEAESRRLLLSVGRRGLNLNSVLGAAILLAVVKHCHAGRPGALFRAIAFADLRPYLEPKLAEDVFGCFVSMLRFVLSVDHSTSLEEAARQLQRQMYQSGRRGELLLFALLSKHLVGVAMRLQQLRLANTALSFMGKLNLQPVYGAVRLEDVHAFITNNRLGPEFSGFGKVLFGRISLDLTYLPAEIEAGKAEKIVEEIHILLRNFG